jgi:choline-glycine betaine transporter
MLGLLGFLVVMWTIVLAACGFLIIFVAPLDSLLGIHDRIVTSLIQALIAILLVVGLVKILDHIKKLYTLRKLKI